MATRSPIGSGPARPIGKPGSPRVSLDDLTDILTPAQLKVIRARLAAQRRPVKPGEFGEVRRAGADVVHGLYLAALSVAGGFDPVVTDPGTPILWELGLDRLLVHPADSKVVLGDGFVDVFLAVECDQTGRTSVVVTFVTATKDRPAGFIVAAEDRPRGPQVIANLWGEAIVALCWRALVETALAVAAEAGSDSFGRPFVPANVISTPDALVVTPMVPHRLSNGSA